MSYTINGNKMKISLTKIALVIAIATLGWKGNYTLIKERKFGNWLIWWLLCIGSFGLFFFGCLKYKICTTKKGLEMAKQEVVEMNKERNKSCSMEEI